MPGGRPGAPALVRSAWRSAHDCDRGDRSVQGFRGACLAGGAGGSVGWLVPRADTTRAVTAVALCAPGAGCGTLTSLDIASGLALPGPRPLGRPKRSGPSIRDDPGPQGSPREALEQAIRPAL